MSSGLTAVRRGLLAGALIAVMSLMGGCALGERMTEIARSITEAGDRIETAHQAFTAANESARHRAAQEVARPWLAGKAQPLAREVTLPLPLRANVDTTLLFDGGPVALPVVAQRITHATGIPVYVRPESLLPAEVFISRLEGASAAAVHPVPHAVALDGGAEPLR